VLIHYVHLAIVLIFWFYVALFLIAPVALRIRFRYSAKVEPRAVSLAELPEVARRYFEPRVAELAPWNFDLVSYVSLGDAVPSAAGYMALLSNPHTAEWADVTLMISAAKQFGYLEFVTRCSDQLQIDTNTSPVVPILFPTPEHHVFRFPQVREVFTLYRIHRMLVTEITHGALPVLPSAGEEIAELKRRLERYGTWQQEHGYMKLHWRKEDYRLTWKGAILGAWRSIWPISALRRWRERRRGKAILERLGRQEQR
jgi:hypothetical protein